MVLMKAFQLHLYVLLGSSIPTEIVRLIVFHALDHSFSKKSYVCGSKHTIVNLKTENPKGSILGRYGDFDYIDEDLTSIDQIFAGHHMSFFLKDNKLYGDRNSNMLMYWLKEELRVSDLSEFRQIFMSREKTKKISFDDGKKIKTESDHFRPLNGFKSISCGYLCVFIITTEGLFACGNNYHGQLGIGDKIEKIHGLKKIKLNNVLKVSCGKLFNMALTKEGLFSCGWNRFGKLGIGSFNNELNCSSFTKIKLQNVIAVECGGNHSLALTTDGLYACGSLFAIRPFTDSVSNSVVYKKGDIQNVVSLK